MLHTLRLFIYNFSVCKNEKTRLVKLKNILPNTKNEYFYKTIKLLNYGNYKQKECAKRIKRNKASY